MDNKRSYLDSLNSGRIRRSQSSLEQLNRSLEQLERQLDQREAQSTPDSYQTRRRRLADEAAFYDASLDERTTARAPSPRPRDDHAPAAQPAEPAYGRSQPNQSRMAEELEALRREMLAQLDTARREQAQRDAELNRNQPDPSRMAEELEALRREMLAQLDTARREQAQRDAELNRNQNEQPSRIIQELDALRSEMREQLSQARREIASRESTRNQSHALTQASEAAEIKSEIERLTDAVQALSQRSDERPLNVLRLELEQARTAIDSLAREDSVRSIGDRWEDFEHRMAAFQENMTADLRARPQDPGVDVLSERLDQMHRALSNLPDSLPLRSLDDKMRKLSLAVEQFVKQQESKQPQSLGVIESRLDEISRAIVASAVASSGSSLDAEQMKRIEARITHLSRQIEDTAKGAPLDETYDRLDSISRRVEDIAGRLESPAPVASFDDSDLMDNIDSRFSDLAQRLDASRASDEAIIGLERRLESIASRLERPAAPSTIDKTLVSNLESQIAGLSQFLSRPEPQNEKLAELAPRLDRMERSIVGNRDLMVEAAREAAERAVLSFSAAPRGDLDAVNGLAGDLKQLESLTRRSDERNSKTFEAIHDTLLKIVDRLGTLEHGGAAQPTPRRKVELPQTPSMDLDLDTGEELAALVERPQWTPAEAAAAAAQAALGEVEVEPQHAKAKRSMLGGIFSRKAAEDAAPPLAGMEPAVEVGIPSVDLDESLDPKAANRPLEPGSGAPDLNAIMKRVRDDRAQPGSRVDADAAKADFIAAARRAAQAAAAEADILKRNSDTTSAGSTGSLPEMLKARRKPILMAAAAVMIALLGLQLGKSFFNDPTEIADASDQPVSQQAAQAPAEPQPMAEQSSEAGSEAPAVRAAENSSEGMPEEATEPVDEQPDVATADSQEQAAHGMQAMAPAEDGQMTAVSTPAPESEGPVGEDAATSEGPAGENPATGDGPVIAAATPADAAAPAAVTKIEVPSDAGPIPLRDAAAAGDSKALFEIGARYADGRGVKTDMAKASEWYEKSAELGFAPAQYRIGNLYEKGNGVKRDVAKAKTWYQLAANQGNASAMHNLAVLFAMGADGTADNDSAARWFTQAAELGVKDSQFNLGILAAKGVGMPQNLEESYKWFALVAKTGDKDAASKRDEIAKSLRPEQLERARGSVELWKPKELNPETNNAEIPESWQESPNTTASIDMKKAIRNVQAILNKNGYDAGGADGVMGQRTKDAIVAFQKDNGLAATGNVDKSLVEALLAKK